MDPAVHIISLHQGNRSIEEFLDIAYVHFLHYSQLVHTLPWGRLRRTLPDIPVSSHKMAASPVSADKMVSIPEPPTVTYVTLAITDATLESSAVIDATSVFPVVMNAAHEDIKAVPRHLRLASSLGDTPLTSVHVAGP